MKYIHALALAILSLTVNAQAFTLSDAQVQKVCKIVDPQFLNFLPVLLDIKAQGATAYEARMVYMYGTGHENVYLPYLEAVTRIIKSNAVTPIEALTYLEDRCVTIMTGKYPKE